MPRSYLIRFKEKEPNPYFEERFKDKRMGVAENIPPKSKFPHWEICEPTIRKTGDVGPGSILFFAVKGSLIVKHVLKVEEKVDETTAERKLGKRWAAFQRKQIRNHTKRHIHSKSKEPRPRNGDIVIGSPSASFSLNNGMNVEDFLEPQMSKKLHNNGMWFKNSMNAQKLYEWLSP